MSKLDELNRMTAGKVAGSLQPSPAPPPMQEKATPPTMQEQIERLYDYLGELRMRVEQVEGQIRQIAEVLVRKVGITD